MRFTGKVTLNIAQRVLVTLGGALLGILLARLLGAEEYGQFAFAYSAIYLLLLPGKIGLDGAATKFVAQYIEKKQFSDLKGYLVRTRQIIVISTTTISLLALTGLFFNDSVTSSQLMLGLAALPTLLLLGHVHRDQFVLIGLNRSEIASLPEGAIRAAVLALLVSLVWIILPQALSAELSLLLNGIGVFVALAVSKRFIEKFCEPLKLADVAPTFHSMLWIRIGAFHLLISCAHVILSQTDLLMLGFFVEEKEGLGYYAVANQISSLLLFFSAAITPIISPRMAAAHAKNDREALLAAARYGTNMAFFLSFPILLGLLFFAKPVISLLYGQEYLSALPILVVLLFAQLGKILSAPIGFFMTMTGREHTATIVIGGAAIINIGLNLALIPLLGTVGAALSTTVTSLLWNAALILFVWRKYGELLLPKFPRELLVFIRKE